MRKPEAGAASLLWPVLLLGLAADQLVRADGAGLNVTLWVTGAVVAWGWQRRGDASAFGPAERALLLGMLALALSVSWREDPTLLLLDAVGLIGSAALLPFATGQSGPLSSIVITVAEVWRAALNLIRRTLLGAAPMLLDASQLRHREGERPTPPFAAIARGALITMPVLLLFGGLLGHADPVFGDFLAGLVRFDPELLVSHVLVTCAACWLAAAALGGALPAERARAAAAAGPQGGSLGAVEVGMMLGGVDLLFAAFIAFQLPYFFGGAAWVERTAGVTLADYARHGFFELVAVSGLTLPLLLLMETWLAPGTGRTLRLYRTLAGWQVVLVLVIMASAVHRMALYQQRFGLTEDRFFASAFIAGLAVTFCWFGATVLRGRSQRFAAGAIVAWAGWLAVLHLINPERVIVETNIARTESGQPLDLSYLTGLTSDAVPALVASLDRVAPAERTQLIETLRHQRASAPAGWRAWHIGRAVAAHLVDGLE